MRRFTLLLALTACGTSDPRTWEKCDLTNCSVSADAEWDVIADGAEISGDYDVVGPPDPYLCLTVKGHSWCSSAKSDDASPRWDQTIARALTVADLTGAAVRADLWDQDTGGLDSNDLICSTELTVTADNLEAGGVRFTCSSNGTTAAFLFRHVQ